ncbi:PadR family transcriptional regulator [Porphyrobacter algicida]|uniref:PadR family transcriptional regulator n=2 Tax=Qipengyuania algicida TaxID=1836209 RepID=A0A845ADL0_9SPHN|nr:PadR family transcriptional regulator [Qipengyuania algicida]
MGRFAAMSGREGSGGGGFFGPDGPFGPSGFFGPDGVFGPRGPFGPDGPFSDGGRQHRHNHGGRRRRGRMFAQGELRLLLLSLIADEPRHGYELIKAIEEMTGDGYSPSPGTIYPTLSLLEDEGLIREVSGSDEPRKAFEVTDKGREELTERADEVAEMRERFARRAEAAEQQAEKGRAYATPEMFRALGNLASVLKNKARSGDLGDETIEQIVDLVDDLARKIERL